MSKAVLTTKVDPTYDMQYHRERVFKGEVAEIISAIIAAT